MVKDHSDNKRENLLSLLHRRVLLYAPSHRQYSICYTSHGAVAGMRNSSMGPPWGTNPMTHQTWADVLHRAKYSICYTSHGAVAGMRNISMGPPWGINPMTHQTWPDALPQSYISLPFSKRLKEFLLMVILWSSI